jgi:hypothetical protein
MSDVGANSVFIEVQAALLNSECDPHEASNQGLCALYLFVSTELESSPLADALARVIAKMGLKNRLPRPERKELVRRISVRPRAP